MPPRSGCSYGPSGTAASPPHLRNLRAPASENSCFKRTKVNESVFKASKNHSSCEEIHSKSGRLRKKITPSAPSSAGTRDFCVRSRWNAQGLQAIAAKLVVGQHLSVTWSPKFSPTNATWHGVVKKITKKSTWVDYGSHGVRAFPPNLNDFTVRQVVVVPKERDKIEFRTDRCSRGDTQRVLRTLGDSAHTTWTGIHRKDL